MKTTNFLIFFFVLLTFSVTNQSCTDPCNDVDCGNNGTCFDGVCICDEGYEGTNCETTSATKYIGTYSAVDICNGQTLPASTNTISQSTTTPTTIEIVNFNALVDYYSISSPVIFTADVNTLTGADQSFTAPSNGEVVNLKNLSGSYDISTKELSFTYEYDVDGASNQVCTSVYTPQ